MKCQLLSDVDGQRTFALVFGAGDEVTAGLQRFADDHRLSAASFTAIGGFERVTLGYFDLRPRDYARIPIDDQVEVLTLAGNIAHVDNERKVHAHVVVGRWDGSPTAANYSMGGCSPP